MGGGPTQSQNSSPPTIPSYLQPILGVGANELFGAMTGGVVPNLTDLYKNVPQLNTPPLTGQQQQLINQWQKVGMSGGVFPYENQAAQQMSQIASPNAAQQAFNDFAVPQTMQQAALAGQATSGAAPYDVAQAAIPFELQDQQTQLQAATGEANLGLSQVQNQMQQLTGSLQAAGMPYEIAQSIAQAEFNKQQQGWGFAKDLQTYPFSLFGNTIGGGQTNVSTGGKF